MEKELNIGKILSSKPEGTKLFDKLRGEVVTLNRVYCDYEIGCTIYGSTKTTYRYTGKLYDNKDAIQILVPSKLMCDWSKFAWKKGDVLASNNVICVFGGFRNDDYTKFNALNAICISPYDNKSEAICPTADFSKVESEKDTKNYLLNSQVIFGNIKFPACDVEKPKQELKDGDIVVAEKDAFYDKVIFIAAIKDVIVSKALINVSEEDYEVQYNEYRFGHNRILRLATDSEKQQLYAALEKKGKAWDEDKKMLVDLPKKCEFKTMDWCLMRDHREKWKLCQFGFFDKGDEYEASYNAVGGNWYNECIPYNDQTAHLLGTTDEWKGDNNV